MLYYVGRKGGDAFVRKRFSAARVDRTLGMVQRHGVLAVLIPSLLPPPAPFKIFVLLAGRGRHQHLPLHDRHRDRPRRPLLRSRGCWPSTTATRRIAFINDNGRPVALVLVGMLAVGFAGYSCGGGSPGGKRL